jgi:hypothetical protein
MSTVKISELPLINQINANTANTLFAGVDIPTSGTFRMTARTLAQGLYSNEVLNVGLNPIVYPGVVAQFAGNNSTYTQINLQNFGNTGSSDYVASTSDSDNSTRYIDMGIDGPTYNDPVNYPYFKPYDGYLYVYGPSANTSSGNLIIGTASSNTNITFVAGLTSYQNIVAKITSTGLALNTQSYMTFGDGSIQKVAASPANYSVAAYAQANVTVGVDTTQNSRISIVEGVVANQTNNITYINGVNLSQNNQITIIQGVDVTQNTAIAATDGKMQSVYNQSNTNVVYSTAAFLKANNALANTINIVTAGELTVSGNIQVLGVGAAGLFTINAVPYVANTPAFKITGSSNTGYSQAPLNQGYMMQITGFANTPSRIVNDAFGANSYPVYVGRVARGSAILPSATQSGDVLLRLSGNGWANNFSQFGQSRIDFVAAENFTDTTKGTQIQFWNTKIGSNTLNQIAIFNGETATFVGNVNPVKGFIYTPNVYPSSQTAITIDFANNSMVRAQTSSGLVVSMNNYTAGKMVELWITNLAGTNQTYTTGVSAINSTLNSTTYTIPGTSTVCAKYFCIDGTLANTLVSVIHA